jgi:hypothetical protein
MSAPFEQEEDRVPTRLVMKVFLGASTLLVVLCLLAYFILQARERQMRPSGRFLERELPPPHRVAEIRQETFDVLPPQPQRLENSENELHRYGWVDEAHGIVRIPIEQAIDLVVSGVKP